jgi:hypothetical protein
MIVEKKAHTTQHTTKVRRGIFRIQIFFRIAERIAWKGKFSEEIDPSIDDEYIYENFLHKSN